MSVVRYKTRAHKAEARLQEEYTKSKVSSPVLESVETVSAATPTVPAEDQLMSKAWRCT